MTAVVKTTEPSFTWNLEQATWANLKKMNLPPVVGPAIKFSLITPTNNTAFVNGNGPTRGIFVGQAGVIYGQDAFGNQVNGIPVIAGYNPISMAGIDATSTTATNIWGVW